MTDLCPACEHQLLKDQQAYMGESTNFLPLIIKNCSHCGLGLADPMPTPSDLDEYYNGQYWTDPGLPFTSQFYPTTYVLAQSRWNQIKLLLEKSTEDSSALKILDIGAGHSFFGAIASKSSIMVDGGYHAVEPDENYRETAQKHWTSTKCHSYFYSSLEQVHDQFDLITISHVLEHVIDPVDFITNITTYLKPNGFLFIEIPHRDDRFKEDVFPHLLFFTKDALSALLTTCGLSPVSVEIRGVEASSSVLSQYGTGLRHYLPRIWHRIGKYLPTFVNLQFYKWLLAPESNHPEGTWVRGIAQKKDH
ncbi:MAG: class I SAM-dependent methyltransferase [Halopseudomonas aestusnigri]